MCHSRFASSRLKIHTQYTGAAQAWPAIPPGQAWVNKAWCPRYNGNAASCQDNILTTTYPPRAVVCRGLFKGCTCIIVVLHLKDSESACCGFFSHPTSSLT